MMNALRPQRIYDHRLRHLVHTTGDVQLALNHGVPRSTAKGWLHQAPREVVTLHVTNMTEQELQCQVFELRARNGMLRALLRLFVVFLKVSGYSLERCRFPDGAKKTTLLRTIESAREILSLRAVLRILRLSPSRYHAWKRSETCSLEARDSCPHSSPHQLTTSEVRVIKEMVTSEDYRHVPRGLLRFSLSVTDSHHGWTSAHGHAGYTARVVSGNSRREVKSYNGRLVHEEYDTIRRSGRLTR